MDLPYFSEYFSFILFFQGLLILYVLFHHFVVSFISFRRLVTLYFVNIYVSLVVLLYFSFILFLLFLDCQILWLYSSSILAGIIPKVTCIVLLYGFLFIFPYLFLFFLHYEFVFFYCFLWVFLFC